MRGLQVQADVVTVAEDGGAAPRVPAAVVAGLSQHLHVEAGLGGRGGPVDQPAVLP